MNVEAVDGRHELRKGVQPRLDLPPVVVGPPVARELLELRQWRALGLIRDGFTVRPARRPQTATQVSEVFLGDIDAERADRFGRRRRGGISGNRLAAPAAATPIAAVARS